MSSIARFTLLALFAATLLPLPAPAAESYDSCTGFIDSVPATLTTQGVWCLRQDLTTAMQTGAAIEIAANNVTIDCNDFKLGGLAAGPTTQAYGVSAVERMNATVRNCGIRGFRTGVRLRGDGHLVEDNRLDGILVVGISVEGYDNLVRRNRVFDTGGADGDIRGIYGSTDVVDNVVKGVTAKYGQAAYGVIVGGDGLRVSGNHIDRIVSAANGIGVYAPGYGVMVSGNHVSIPTGTRGIQTGPGGICHENMVWGDVLAYQGCAASHGNLSAN